MTLDPMAFFFFKVSPPLTLFVTLVKANSKETVPENWEAVTPHPDAVHANGLLVLQL